MIVRGKVNKRSCLTILNVMLKQEVEELDFDSALCHTSLGVGWKSFLQCNGAYMFAIALDYRGCNTVRESIEKFKVLGVFNQGVEEIGTFPSFYEPFELSIGKLPEFIRKYSVRNFVEFD